MNKDPHSDDRDIAVIGMAGRFPQAWSLEQFWENLKNGTESVTEFSDAELQPPLLNPDEIHHPDYVKAGVPLDGVSLFDAAFFGMSAREAEVTDPQHRLFVECAWEALESAGYDARQYPGLIGVYGSTGAKSYFLNNVLLNPYIRSTLDAHQLAIASEKDYLATRVSYLLDLKGPSLSVQTACSSSLVSLHLARQSLLNGDCNMALVGGVSLRVPQKQGHLHVPGAILSSDGHTRSFDARASGTTFSSGVGVVVLKRLADARADGDYIRAVIKGTAVNNDGAAKASYTAPSLTGQVAAIMKAFDTAGVDPDTITYVEAHGTATSSGDPIEIGALTKAFRTRTNRKGFCAIGTVKMNIGHTDIASGVAGVIKTVLSLEHCQIPPSPNFERPNPAIDFVNSPFYVARALSEWTSPGGGPRRAAVGAMGIGGTNAYAVLEEAPVRPPSGPSRPWQLLTLSAKTPSALQTATENLASHLTRHPDANLADVCYTLNTGRRAFRYRKAVTCRSTAEAVDLLEGRLPGNLLAGTAPLDRRPVLFMFSGQGSEHVNMTLDLYRQEADFRQTIDHCAEFLKPSLGLDLREVLYPAAEQADVATRALARPLLAQPAVFVVNYALARLWIQWGVYPDGVLGYSSGELAAACVAGVFPLEDALTIVATRGQVIERLPEGAMLSVARGRAEIAEHLGPGLSIASDGGADFCVVAGPPDQVRALERQLKDLRVPCNCLPVSRAYHSPMLDPVLEELESVVAKARRDPARILFVSGVTGAPVEPADLAAPSYWSRQLRQPVRFAQALASLKGDEILLEIGPNQNLTDLTRRFLKRSSRIVALACCPDSRNPQPDAAFFLRTMGRLWLMGVPLDWRSFYARERRQRLPLPTYPFERQSYWVDPQICMDNLSGRASRDKKPDLAEWFYTPSWKRMPRTQASPSRPQHPSPWLVFADAGGLGEELVVGLQQVGQTAITVIPGERFAVVRPGVYSVDPLRTEDYASLLGELASAGHMPTNIVHLWSTEPADSGAAEAKRFDHALDMGYYSILAIVQAIARRNFTDPVQLQVVSSGIQAVIGEEPLHPEKAVVLGLCTVISQEYPNITCRCIDVESTEAGSFQRVRLARQLLAESMLAAPDRVVACRGEHRWARTFEPIRLERQPQADGLLRHGGVYLITGGLGDIGLALADYLWREAQAKLVLVGRSGLPPRRDWDRILSGGHPQDKTCRRIRQVRELEKARAEVLVLAADVGDEAQIKAAVDLACERFGEIHGVFHGAGLVEDQAFADIPRIGRRESELHFVPKVRGMLALEKALQGRAPDFYVLLSSVAALVGGVQNAAYASANAFLDALAQHRNQTAGPAWISINWDLWDFPEMRTQGRANLIPLAIGPGEGVEAFHRILCTRGLGQIVVSTIDLLARMQEDTVRGMVSGGEAAPAADSGALHHRHNLLSEYVAPEDGVQKAIATIWEDLFGMDQIGIHDNFFELGGHSLLATRLVSRLRKTLLVAMPIGVLFEAPTIAELAERVRMVDPLGGQEGLRARLLEGIEELSEAQARAILEGERDESPQEPQSR